MRAVASNNKQRVTLVTAKERRAAVSGGVVDDRVPDESIKCRLSSEANVAFDVDEIIRAIARSAGRVRGFSVPGMGVVPPVRMERAEIVQQSQEAIRTIDALTDRLANLHPDLDCWANDILMQTHGEHIDSIVERCEKDLMRIRAAINHAGHVVAKYPAKTGPKPSTFDTAVKEVAGELRERSKPRLAAKACKDLAIDLLQLCGLESPRKSRGT